MNGRLITKADLPLSPEKLAEVRRFCLEENGENVRVLCGCFDRLPKVLTQDWTDESLSLHDRANKHINVNPCEWRMALQNECIEKLMLEYVDNEEKFENTQAIMMWRAALAFSHELYSYGIEQCHVDFKREKTDDGRGIKVVQKKSFNYEAEVCLEHTARVGHPLIFPDVMLALGTSAIEGIRFVKKKGAHNEQITVICVSAAPEGVYNLLITFPGIKIITYEMGGRLNEDAYIVDTGLGDAGDKFFRAVNLSDFQPIRSVFHGDWWEYLACQIDLANAI